MCVCVVYMSVLRLRCDAEIDSDVQRLFSGHPASLFSLSDIYCHTVLLSLITTAAEKKDRVVCLFTPIQ